MKYCYRCWRRKGFGGHGHGGFSHGWHGGHGGHGGFFHGYHGHGGFHGFGYGFSPQYWFPINYYDDYYDTW